MAYQDELKRKFNDHFPTVVENLIKNSKTSACQVSANVDWALEKMKDSLNYNVPDGKQTRGLTVVLAYYKIFGNDISEDKQKILFDLGWAVEILQAAFLVADDVMDQSEKRRTKSCWYKKPEVGLSAINDAFILESCVFTLLKLSCRDQPFYLDLVDLFHSTILQTQIGQTLDTAITSNESLGNFDLFTKKYYMDTITYKTSFYSFYLPVAIAMYAGGYRNKEVHKKVSDILVKIGQLFQIQDDFLDCFGKEEVIGKVGTDIQENKCSWLIVRALECAKENDIETLKANYGRKDDKMFKQVKSVYMNLKMEDLFRECEEDFYNNISKEISEFEEEIPKDVFTDLLEKIYRRKK